MIAKYMELNAGNVRSINRLPNDVAEITLGVPIAPAGIGRSTKKS